MTLRELILKALSEDVDLDCKVVFDPRPMDEVEDVVDQSEDGDTIEKGVLVSGPTEVSFSGVNADGEIVLGK